MKLDNLDKTMEIIRKIYTCEIPMFDEEGDDWTEEYTDFDNSLDDLIKNPGYFKIECIPKLMELFNDTLNYDTLMSALADLVINIACFYGNEGIHKLLESFVCVKVEGRMYGKMHLVGGLLHNHFEELKMALSTSTDEVKLEFKTILSTIEFKNLLKEKEELLKMLPQGKMNLLSIVNSKFESLYSKEERSSIKVTLDDIDKIINIARMPLPEMLKSVLEEGEIYCLEIKETSIIICFCYAIDIINMDDNYPYFKEDVEEGLIFATDLGGNVYYYGKGREGLGLYIVGAGDGNFFDEATKFASTFEEFFIEGIGIDILKKYYRCPT